MLQHGVAEIVYKIAIVYFEYLHRKDYIGIFPRSSKNDMGVTFPVKAA